MHDLSAVRMARHWKRLSREVVDAPSLKLFNASLDGALSNLVFHLLEGVPAPGGGFETR